MATRRKPSGAKRKTKQRRVRASKAKAATAPRRRLPEKDPLIAPGGYRLRSKLLRGTIRVQRRLPRSFTDWEEGTIPPQLEAFVREPSIERLCIVLRRHPGLYWHPIVRRQIAYLQQAWREPLLWDHLGWVMNDDRPPLETLDARAALEQVVAAHAEGMTTGRRVKFERTRRQPGPRGRLPNPYPISPDYRLVSANELDSDQRALSVLLHEHGQAYAKARRKDEYVLKALTPLIQRALREEGPVWSAKRGGLDVSSAVASDPLPVAKRRALAATSPTEDWLIDIRSLGARWYSDKQLESRGLSLIEELSYAILAELLDVKPYRVFTTVAAYRRAHPQRRARRYPQVT